MLDTAVDRLHIINEDLGKIEFVDDMDKYAEKLASAIYAERELAELRSEIRADLRASQKKLDELNDKIERRRSQDRDNKRRKRAELLDQLGHKIVLYDGPGPAQAAPAENGHEAPGAAGSADPAPLMLPPLPNPPSGFRWSPVTVDELYEDDIKTEAWGLSPEREHPEAAPEEGEGEGEINPQDPASNVANQLERELEHALSEVEAAEPDSALHHSPDSHIVLTPRVQQDALRFLMP